MHKTDREKHSEPFRRCTFCGHLWETREEFLRDPEISLAGYQPHFEDLEAGLFLFNHAPCQTTLALRAAWFTDLHRGPIFETRLTGGSKCPGYCLREQELGPCAAACECAYVRDVLDRIARWPKRALRAAAAAD